MLPNIFISSCKKLHTENGANLMAKNIFLKNKQKKRFFFFLNKNSIKSQKKTELKIILPEF